MDNLFLTLFYVNSLFCSLCVLYYGVDTDITLSGRMLQDHDGVQPCPDGSAVCGLLDHSVPAHWWTCKAHWRYVLALSIHAYCSSEIILKLSMRSSSPIHKSPQCLWLQISAGFNSSTEYIVYDMEWTRSIFPVARVGKGWQKLFFASCFNGFKPAARN